MGLEDGLPSLHPPMEAPPRGRQILGTLPSQKGLPLMALQEVRMEGTSQCHTQAAGSARILSRGWLGASGSVICRGRQRTTTQHAKAVKESTARGVRWGHHAILGGQ